MMINLIGIDRLVWPKSRDRIHEKCNAPNAGRKEQGNALSLDGGDPRLLAGTRLPWDFFYPNIKAGGCFEGSLEAPLRQ